MNKENVLNVENLNKIYSKKRSSSIESIHALKDLNFTNKPYLAA